MFLNYSRWCLKYIVSAGNTAETRRDCVCAGRVVARGYQPGRHRRRHTELLQHDQLPHRVAQDGPRQAQVVQEMVSDSEGELNTASQS